MEIGKWYSYTGSASDSSQLSAGVDIRIASRNIASNYDIIQVRPWCDFKKGTGHWNWNPQAGEIRVDGSSKTWKQKFDMRDAHNVHGYYYLNEYPYKLFENTGGLKYDSSYGGHYAEYTVYHNANGSKSFNLYAYLPFDSAAGYQPHTVNTTITLPDIDTAAPKVVGDIDSVTHNSMYVRCGVNYGCRDGAYSLNGGSWVSCPIEDYFTITGLSPKTSYNIVFRAYRQHNGKVGYSEKQYATTYPTPVYVDYLYVTATSPTELTVTVSASSADVDYIDVSCSDGQSKRIRAQDATFTFTVAPETYYAVGAVAVTKVSGVASSAVTKNATTPADSFCYIVEPNGSVSSKKKMFLIDTNGVVTEIKKDMVSVI